MDDGYDSLQVFGLRNNSEWELSMSRTGPCNNGDTMCPCNDTETFLAHRFYIIFTTASDGEGTGFEISYSSLGELNRLSL